MPVTSPEVLLREAARRASQRLTEHIERFAAAYVKQTKIKPDEACMCYKMQDDGSMRVWFEQRTVEASNEFTS